ALFVIGCSNNAAKNTPATTQEIGTAPDRGAYSGQPEWILMPEVEGATAAVGSARIGRAGLQFARTQALLSARAELARTVEVKVKDLTKNYTNVVGAGDNEVVETVATNVSKSVASQTLKGSKQMNVYISPNNELFVLVAIPNADLKEDIKSNFINELQSEAKLYQEFKADQGFKELDAEIEKSL
ncbi:MAG: LPP20 family lipoprotein, partial [Cetobacterium sp.]